MATVVAFSLEGLKLWFHSNDHEPPHFHAKRRGEWEVKVHFLEDGGQMIEVKWQVKAPSARTLKEITTLAAEHRASLLEEWEAVHPKPEE
jgi:hypothetical protein